MKPIQSFLKKHLVEFSQKNQFLEINITETSSGKSKIVSKYSNGREIVINESKDVLKNLNFLIANDRGILVLYTGVLKRHFHVTRPQDDINWNPFTCHKLFKP
jgi:hypothetical protein